MEPVQYVMNLMENTIQLMVPARKNVEKVLDSAMIMLTVTMEIKQMVMDAVLHVKLNITEYVKEAMKINLMFAKIKLH